MGLPIIGVPKTIDNDLSSTDFAFGYQTAVEIATDALDKLVTTAESHNRLMILEVMGRNAGWISLFFRPDFGNSVRDSCRRPGRSRQVRTYGRLPPSQPHQPPYQRSNCSLQLRRFKFQPGTHGPRTGHLPGRIAKPTETRRYHGGNFHLGGC